MARRKALTVDALEQRKQFTSRALTQDQRDRLIRLARFKGEKAAAMDFLAELEERVAMYGLRRLVDRQELPSHKAKAFDETAKALDKLAEAIERDDKFKKLVAMLNKSAPEIRATLFVASAPADEATLIHFPQNLRAMADRARREAERCNARVRGHCPVTSDQLRQLAREMQTIACQYNPHLRADWTQLRKWLAEALGAFGVGSPRAKDKREFDALMLPALPDGSLMTAATGGEVPPAHKRKLSKPEQCGPGALATKRARLKSRLAKVKF
ncbi:MAG: hypothetical protein ACLPSW_35135 [Roseiarcus sp.]